MFFVGFESYVRAKTQDMFIPRFANLLIKQSVCEASTVNHCLASLPFPIVAPIPHTWALHTHSKDAEVFIVAFAVGHHKMSSSEDPFKWSKVR